MGQSTSSELDAVDYLQDDLIRQARNWTELATLTYEEFLGYIKELNEMSQKWMDADGRQLVFAVKEGSDSSVLWKGKVMIACAKIDPVTSRVETYRLINLIQFLKVYKSISIQCAAAAAPEAGGSDNRLSASAVLREVVTECCICLERQSDMVLSCTHAYCRPCIESWSVKHKTCPLCREVTSNEDAWVMSEAPNSLEMSEEICSSLLELVDRQPSTDTETSNDIVSE